MLRRVPGTGVGHPAGHRPPDQLAQEGAGLEQALHVDARGHPEVVEEGHGVLGGDVARGAGGERRAADPADAGVEPPDPALQAGVEVHADPWPWSRGGGGRRRRPVTSSTSSIRRGVAMPVVSASVRLAAPPSRRRRPMVATSLRREVALVGRPEGARHHGVDRHAGVGRQRADRTGGGDRLLDRHPDVAAAVGLRRRDRDRQLVDLGGQGQLGASQVGHQRGAHHTRATPDEPHHLGGAVHRGHGLGRHERHQLDVAHAGVQQGLDRARPGRRRPRAPRPAGRRGDPPRGASRPRAVPSRGA